MEEDMVTLWCRLRFGAANAADVRGINEKGRAMIAAEYVRESGFVKRGGELVPMLCPIDGRYALSFERVLVGVQHDKSGCAEIVRSGDYVWYARVAHDGQAWYAAQAYIRELEKMLMEKKS